MKRKKLQTIIGQDNLQKKGRGRENVCVSFRVHKTKWNNLNFKKAFLSNLR